MPADPCLLHLALGAWPAIWLSDLLRYVIPAGLAAMALSLLPKTWLNSRRVQLRQPLARQRRREVLFSMLTVLVFSTNGAVIFAGAKAGVLHIYTELDKFGWAYLTARSLRGRS